MITSPIEISLHERQNRIDAVRDWLRRQDLSGLCVFNQTLIAYLVGYHFQQTERPVALVISVGGRQGILVPALESDHVRALPLIDEIVDYPEYPGLRHPMYFLADLIQGMAIAPNRLAADQPAYPPVWGYRGPTLAELFDLPRIPSAADFLSDLRSRKSAEIVDLLRQSAYWGNLAHEILQQSITTGRTEIEIGQAASQAATAAMFAQLGSAYRNHDWGVTPIHVGFKAGPETAFPHPMGTSRPIGRGDLIITWSTAKMAGYHAELERTLIVGEAGEEQRFFFDHMCRAQEIGIAAIGPGRRCADVDQAVYDYWAGNDLLPYVRHHTGHALGMEIHEAPFLDRGDQTLLAPGMVFSVEPGLYVPGVGGFRHSDTVLVTEDGHEVLTYYPRQLGHLTIQP
jgi:Xaa-Pro dipeptidase